MSGTEKLRARLLALRGELEALDDASADSRATVELDQTSVGRLSRIDALQSQQMALATQRRRIGEIARIDAALGRLDEGTYGACVVCGEDIAPKRLDLDPAAPNCLRCAQAGER